MLIDCKLNLLVSHVSLVSVHQFVKAAFSFHARCYSFHYTLSIFPSPSCLFALFEYCGPPGKCLVDTVYHTRSPSLWGTHHSSGSCYQLGIWPVLPDFTGRFTVDLLPSVPPSLSFFMYQPFRRLIH